MKNCLFIVLLFLSVFLGKAQTRWTNQKANAWYAKQGLLLGSNYTPAYAVNQLEMFQAETFDPKAIDKELALAESIGLNTMRIFLHDLLWQQDAKGFSKRLDLVLGLCAQHKIKPMIVLFDSCWNPVSKLGIQPAPTPGVHNSGWLQAPGAAALTDISEYPRLEAYVKGIVKRFANDPRILCWDVWNEPDNTNENSYGINSKQNLEPANKVAIVNKLLPKVFEWVRSQKPIAPLTCGVWKTWINHWENESLWSETERIQFTNSDIISFHAYNGPEDFAKIIEKLKILDRPLFCTEYMARGAGSTFQTHLPIAKANNIAMINWGFVQGKIQTEIPWDSWEKPYVGDHIPKIWFHEIFRNDLSPYNLEELESIKKFRSKK
jgi:hypothetical protein